MDTVIAVFQWFHSDAGLGVLAGLFLISEALGSIPAVKSNSVFQLVANILSRFKKQPV